MSGHPCRAGDSVYIVTVKIIVRPTPHIIYLLVAGFQDVFQVGDVGNGLLDEGKLTGIYIL